MFWAAAEPFFLPKWPPKGCPKRVPNASREHLRTHFLFVGLLRPFWTRFWVPCEAPGAVFGSFLSAKLAREWVMRASDRSGGSKIRQATILEPIWNHFDPFGNQFWRDFGPIRHYERVKNGSITCLLMQHMYDSSNQDFSP